MSSLTSLRRSHLCNGVLLLAVQVHHALAPQLLLQGPQLLEQTAISHVELRTCTQASSSVGDGPGVDSLPKDMLGKVFIRIRFGGVGDSSSKSRRFLAEESVAMDPAVVLVVVGVVSSCRSFKHTLSSCSTTLHTCIHTRWRIIAAHVCPRSQGLSSVPSPCVLSFLFCGVLSLSSLRL